LLDGCELLIAGCEWSGVRTYKWLGSV